MRVQHKFPFLKSADEELLDAIYSGETKSLQLALAAIKKGANINTVADDGTTMLLLALEQEKFDVAEMLVKKGASLSMADMDGLAPLSSAVQAGRVDLARLMLKKGADVNMQDEFGWTPLMNAIGAQANRENIEPMVRLLLEYDADRYVESKEGYTATMLAHNMNLDHILDLIATYPTAAERRATAAKEAAELR